MALLTISSLSVNVILEVSHFEIVLTKNPKLKEINAAFVCKFLRFMSSIAFLLQLQDRILNLKQRF
jgi:hypothetical protein